MELTLITIRQVTELLMMILAGYVCCRVGVLKPADKSVLSNLLVNLINPAMILNSYLVEFDPETFHNLLLSFVFSTVVLGVAMLTAFLCVRRCKKDERVILWLGAAFSNAGYMGFPLIKALFGAEGMLYASGFVTMFNIFIWTIGYAAATGKADPKTVAKSIVTCPCILAVAAGLLIYLSRITLPQILAEPIELVGNMNTPVSMLVTGVTIAAADVKALLRRKSVYWVWVMRLLLIPAIETVIFAVLGLNGMVPMVALMLGACPTAATTTVFAIQYGHDQELAAGSVILTTLCSVLTLPLYALLLTVAL